MPTDSGTPTRPGRPPATPAGEPPPWTAPGTLSEASFPGGLRACDPAADGFLVSGRSLGPESVLLGAAWDGRSWAALPARAVTAVDGVVTIEVDGLSPDTPHTFVLTTPDGARRSAAGVWRTLPDRPRPLRFGATSCLGSHDPAWPTLAVAAGLGLDWLLLLGDTIYTRARTLDGYRAEYDALLATSSFRALSASTPLVAVWDDHEVANDWTLGPPSADRVSVTPEQVAAAAAAMAEVLPWRPGPGGGQWRSLEVAGLLELLLLDCRAERDGDVMVSEAQLAWAEARLRDGACPARVVASSVHAADHGAALSVPGDDADVADRWQGFAAQRDRLVAAAEARPGTWFVTGDMHYGGLQTVGRAGEPGEGLIEVCAGPAGSVPWDVEAWLAAQGPIDPRYRALLGEATLAVFEVGTDGAVSVELIGADGGVRARS